MTASTETIRSVVAIIVAAVLVIVGVWQQNLFYLAAGASFLGIPGLAAVTTKRGNDGTP